MSKEQIEEMTKDVCGHCRSKCSYTYFECEMAIEAAYTAGYSKQEWINVDERLPGASGYVLVYTTAKNYIAVPYSKKYKLFNARDDSTEDEAKGLSIRVSYWMPIPEPPKT